MVGAYCTCAETVCGGMFQGIVLRVCVTLHPAVSDVIPLFLNIITANTQYYVCRRITTTIGVYNTKNVNNREEILNSFKLSQTAKRERGGRENSTLCTE